MDDTRKKTIMIVVIIICLVSAALITIKTTATKPDPIAPFKGQLIWVKCRSCQAEYQKDKADYFYYVEEHMNPMSLSAPPLPCEKCQKEAVYRAVKCEKCGLVFERGTVPSDFADRCPKCKYSDTQEKRKQARLERERKKQ